MPNPLRFLKDVPKNLGTSANRTSALIDRGLRSEVEKESMSDLARRLQTMDVTHADGIDPQTNFLLWLNAQKNPMRQVPVEGVQERLQGFDKGGSVLDKKRSWTDDVSDGAFNIVQSGLQALKREGPMAVAGFIPGGRLMIGAQLASDSGEAEAMPFHSWMKAAHFLPGGKQAVTPLFVNPTQSELAEVLKATRASAIRDNSAPTVRYLVDLKGTGRPIYAADGNEVLHSQMRTHLGLSQDDTLGEMWAQGRQQGTPYDMLEYLRTWQQPVKKAHGGLVSLRKECHCG